MKIYNKTICLTKVAEPAEPSFDPESVGGDTHSVQHVCLSQQKTYPQNRTSGSADSAKSDRGATRPDQHHLQTLQNSSRRYGYH